MKRVIWTTLLLISNLAVLAVAALLASHEFTLNGSVLSFILIVMNAYTLGLVFGRPVTANLIVVTLLGALYVLNDLKFKYLKEMVHVLDLSLISSWFFKDTSFLSSYFHIVAPVVGLILVAVVALILLARAERRAASLHAARPGGWSVLAFVILTAVANGAIFSSHYMRNVDRLPFYYQLSVYSGLRVSYLFSMVRSNATIRQGIDASGADGSLADKADRPPATPCGDCPDLIIYHVESVFDPAMLTAFEGEVPLMRRMAQTLPSAVGYLRTNVFGGRSMISEFELLCGVNHQIFDVAGSYPNLYLQAFIRRCGPSVLGDAGYETITLYSTPANLNHAGNMFRAYGFNEFRDSRQIGMPNAWHEMRDKYMVDEALKILAQPRTRPRLVLISTMYNHGPHSLSRITQRYDGPYDIDRVSDGGLKDYLNRLNDTLQQVDSLNRYIRSTNVPTLVLYYGDHQPQLDNLRFTEAARQKFGAAARYMTFFTMVANHGPPGQIEIENLRIENLLGRFLDFGQLERLNAFSRVEHVVAANCNGVQTECAVPVKKALRAFVQGGR